MKYAPTPLLHVILHLSEHGDWLLDGCEENPEVAKACAEVYANRGLPTVVIELPEGLAGFSNGCQMCGVEVRHHNCDRAQIRGGA